jgi:hypothetical protein
MEERRRKETRKEKTKKKLPQAWDRLPHAGCTLAAADGHEVETEAAGGGGGGGGGGIKHGLFDAAVWVVEGRDKLFPTREGHHLVVADDDAPDPDRGVAQISDVGARAEVCISHARGAGQ